MAGCKQSEPIWASLASTVEGKDVKELLSNIRAGGAPSTSAAAAKEEEKEESDEDMLSTCLSRSVSCSFQRR